MSVPIMSHVVILPLLLDVVGRDAWISVLLSIPAALLFAFAIYRVRLHYPDSSISDLLNQVLGKWVGRGVSYILSLYFTFLMVLSFACLTDLIFIVFLPGTPRYAPLAWFWIFALYASSKGIKRIALTAGVLTMSSLVLGPIITLLSTTKKHWNQLLPILEYGWTPVILGTLILISVWMELLFLLCVPVNNIGEKRFFLIWGGGILFNGYIMLSSITGVITIFGLSLANNFVYPAIESIRLINIGIIDRMDVYGLVVMTFGTYIRCSLYLRLAIDVSLSKYKSKWGKRGVFAFLGLVGFFGALFFTRNHIQLDRVIIIYSYMLILFPLPFLLLGVSHLKRKKERTSQTNSVQQSN